MSLFYKCFNKALWICLLAFCFDSVAGDPEDPEDCENDFSGQIHLKDGSVPKNGLLNIYRPDFNDQEAYEAWLIENQKKGTPPEFPYGYRMVRVQIDEVQVSIHHTIRPAIAPPWVDNNKLFNGDWDTQHEYMSWAEAYYKKSQFYPPGYLKWMKDLISIRLLLQRGAPRRGGIKDDRRLEDVVLALGGNRHARQYDSSSSKLMSLITELNGNERWLDGGTGSGFVLEDSILVLNGAGFEITDIPYTLGITYVPEFAGIDQLTTVNRPTGVSFNEYHSQLPENLSVKHEMWNKRLFQDIPKEEFNPRAKLITDFYGVFSYSIDPAGVIDKYLKIMDEGGTIGIVYGNSIVRVGDKDLPFHEWLKAGASNQISIEYGISRVKNSYSTRVDKDGYTEDRYVLIQNPSGHVFEIPSLVQVGFTEKDGQWMRIFRPTSDIQNIP